MTCFYIYVGVCKFKNGEMVMKFSQVNAEQIRQANEAIETIIKLKKNLAEQRLINRSLGKLFLKEAAAFIY